MDRDQLVDLTRRALKLARDKTTDLSPAEYRVDARAGAGIGIYGILSFGMSLLYVVNPGASTQAFLFLPTVQAFADFRKSFRGYGFRVGK